MRRVVFVCYVGPKCLHKKRLVASDESFFMKGLILTSTVLLFVQSLMYFLDCIFDFMRVQLYHDIIISVVSFTAAVFGGCSFYFLSQRLVSSLGIAKAQFCLVMTIFFFVSIGHCHSIYSWLEYIYTRSSNGGTAAVAGWTFFRITLAALLATMNLAVVQILLANFILSFPTKAENLEDVVMLL